MTISTMQSRHDVVHIKGLSLPFFIGIHDFEKERRQTVTIDVAMGVSPAVRGQGEYVSYAVVTEYAMALSQSDAHIELVETLAEMLLAKALEDQRVEEATVTVLKPDIYPDAAGVGITIHGARNGRRDAEAGA